MQGRITLFPASSPDEELHLPTHNLPLSLTPLVGREQAIVTASTLLQRLEIRLLTLTGTGGVGKTRMALQIALNLLEHFADGVYFVSLAPLNDPALVIPTIVQTLELEKSIDQSSLEQLKTHVRGKQLLLLLDNFEQVASAGPLLVELLQACPTLKIVVTSRMVLHLRGEYEFLVPPLALPDLSHLPENEGIAQCEAVALFVQCAQAIKHDFQVTAANARVIAEICTRLDGLPLAIELAAARLTLLSPRQLLLRLQHQLHILTHGAHDLPERQQTLRDTIQWSYHLLNAKEQRLFQRLVVFAGGCTLEAVEAVCQAAGDGTEYVLDGLTSLLENNLLYRREQPDGEPRLLMLETIRDYGLACLEASGEMEHTRRAHAVYFVGLTEEANQERSGPQQTAWMERLEREIDNLRAAMQWLMENPEGEERKNRVELALRLGKSLSVFWSGRVYVSEGRTFVERVLQNSEEAVPSLRAQAMQAVAYLAFIQGDDVWGETMAEKSLALFQELGDTCGTSVALRQLGGVARRRGDRARAQALYEEALTLGRRAGNKSDIANMLLNLAFMAQLQGDYARAYTTFEEVLEIHRELGNRSGIAGTLLQLAEVLFIVQGDQTRIRTLLDESSAISREVGDNRGIASVACLSAQVVLEQGDVSSARSLAEQALSLFKEREERPGVNWALNVLGKVAAAEKDYAAAFTLHQESLAVARSLGEQSFIVDSLGDVADTAAALGKLVWAARLWGAAETIREAIMERRWPVYQAHYECCVSAVRTQLGDAVFTRAWNEGRTMSLDQVLSSKWSNLLSEHTPSATSAMKLLPPKPSNGLTARELEVLRLLARGMTSAQIAERLVISLLTVNTHIRSIYSKLGVTSRSAATCYAIEHGLV